MTTVRPAEADDDGKLDLEAEVVSLPPRSADGLVTEVLAGAGTPRERERHGGQLVGEAAFSDALQTVWNTALEALIVVDDARAYLRVNDAAVKLLGAPPRNIIGRRIEDFTPPEHYGRLDELWARFREERTLAGPYVVLRGDGSRVDIEFRAAWDFGEREHLIVARDVPKPHVELHRDTILTPREREILQLASQGLTVPSIAERLVLSPATVKTHFQNVYAKLPASDRASAVAQALRRGLID